MSRINKFGEILRDIEEIGIPEKFTSKKTPVFSPPSDEDKEKLPLPNHKKNIIKTTNTQTPSNSQIAKLPLSHKNEGEKILSTGKFEYHGTLYDLKLLSNLTDRLSNEILNASNETEYASEILTIAMQIRRRALETILKYNQGNFQKKQELQNLITTQTIYNQQGVSLTASQITTKSRDSELLQKYFSALNAEIKKQIDLNIKALKNDEKIHDSK